MFSLPLSRTNNCSSINRTMTGANLQINVNSLCALDSNKNASRSSSVVGQENVQPNSAAMRITASSSEQEKDSGTVNCITKKFGKHLERSGTGRTGIIKWRFDQKLLNPKVHSKHNFDNSTWKFSDMIVGGLYKPIHTHPYYKALKLLRVSLISAYQRFVYDPRFHFNWD